MIIFEDIDYTFRIAAENTKEVLVAAVKRKLKGFKIYNKDGHFIREYALFDGKYRKILKEGELDYGIR